MPAREDTIQSMITANNAAMRRLRMATALNSIADRLEAWAEYSEHIVRTEADSPRTEQHANIAANYRALISMARAAIENEPIDRSTDQ